MRALSLYRRIVTIEDDNAIRVSEPAPVLLAIDQDSKPSLGHFYA